MDDEFDYEPTPIPPRRFRHEDALVMVFRLPRLVFEALADWFEEVTEMLGAHANWKLEQETPIKVTQ